MGTNGRISDGGVIENTKLYQNLVNGQLNLPDPTPVGEGSTELPYVFIADEAFALRKDLLKPFSQKDLNHEKKIYNYRLSRARRIIENVFGIMAARFRILNTAINLRLDRVNLVVMTCAVLHNFLRRKCSSTYCPMDCFDREDRIDAEITPGLEMDRNVICKLQCGNNRHYGSEANNVRNLYLQYFNGPGKVPWQCNMIR